MYGLKSIQEYTTSIEGKGISHQHLITYVSGLFQGSPLNWATFTKEAYAIYMSIRKLKKLSIYLVDAFITFRGDHLPLKRFLQKIAVNAKSIIGMLNLSV